MYFYCMTQPISASFENSCNNFHFESKIFSLFFSSRWTFLLTMKKSTLILLLIAVLGALFIQSVESSPLFFDFFKNIFGGSGRQKRPSYNNNQNQWANGGRVVKQKRFPWDIFGMFGFKNVIRPNKRPNNNNNYRPPNPGRPTTQWPSNNNCGSCGWDISQNTIGQNRPVSTNLPNYGNRQPNYRPPNNVQPTSVGTQPSYGGQRPNGFTTRSPIVSVAAPNPNTRRPTVGSQVPNNNVNNNAVNVGGGSFSPAQQYFPVNGNGNLPTYFPTLPASDFTTPTPQRQQTQVR